MKSLYEDLVKVREKVIKEALEGFTTKTKELLPKIPKRSPGPQLRAMLKNNGVTDDELRYLKLDDVLNKDMVTKDEVAGHLESKGVPFHDTDYAKEKGARYQEYALKGGKNYGEKIVHYKPEDEREDFKVEWDKLEKPEYSITKEQHNGYKPGADRSGRWNPPERPIAEVLVEDWYKGGSIIIGRIKDENNNPYKEEGNRSRWTRVYDATCTSEEQKDKCVEDAKERCAYKLNQIDRRDNIDPNKEYQSGHWDGSNQLFHVRHQEFEDADGKNLWLIEEIQSDWHQSARKKGYSKVEYNVHNAAGNRMFKRGGKEATVYKDRAEAEAHAAEDPTWRVKETRSPGVPDAPMKKSWEENAFKYALQQAIKAGADRIGWVTGEISADRYDLSKQIGSVMYNEKKGWVLRAYKPASEDVAHIEGTNGGVAFEKAGVQPEEISDVIGKELAERLLSQPEDKEGRRWLRGVDIKVGGEGMKAAYDQRIPSIAKKIAKAGGSTVGKVILPDSEDSGEEMDMGESMTIDTTRGRLEGDQVKPADDDDTGDDVKWYVTYEDRYVSGPFETEEEASEDRIKQMTIREGKKGHEVWYMDITPGIKDLVSKGLRLALESVAAPDWFVVKDAT